jgi:hypothetical protein
MQVMSDLTITETEKSELLAGASCQGLYCNACSKCKTGCPNNLPIPELMRAYMYAYGYGNLAMASELVSETAVKADPCAGCNSCTASCVKGFNLRGKIADISRLADVPFDLIT